MHIFGNITGTSKYLRQYVRMNFNVIEVINSIIRTTSVFPVAFSKNFVWVAKNLSLDPEDLSLREV